MTDARRPVTRRTARGIILTPGADGFDLILIHRTRPGTAAYWTTPGGGMEPDDPTLSAALVREVLEETGATIGPAVPVYLHTTPRPTPDHPNGVKTAVFFVCRLLTIDDRLRHGPEVTDPHGTYRTDRVPYTPAALTAINLSPPFLAPYLTANREVLTALLPPDAP